MRSITVKDGRTDSERETPQRVLRQNGPLGEAFDRKQDRKSLETLSHGANDYFRNQLAHKHVMHDDSMYARETILLGDLLVRTLDELKSERKVNQLEDVAEAQSARVTETALRKLSSREFQKRGHQTCERGVRADLVGGHGHRWLRTARWAHPGQAARCRRSPSRR
jgi:hypothetical protein